MGGLGGWAKNIDGIKETIIDVKHRQQQSGDCQRAKGGRGSGQRWGMGTERVFALGNRHRIPGCRRCFVESTSGACRVLHTNNVRPTN